MGTVLLGSSMVALTVGTLAPGDVCVSQLADGQCCQHCEFWRQLGQKWTAKLEFQSRAFRPLRACSRQ